MRILYFDIDTLRADRLGCYGYLRATSPNIDRIAAEGVRLEHCLVSDAPCLPSRASMFTGRFGIHTGMIGHGGRCADPWPIGRQRAFNTMRERGGLVWQLRQAGLYPATVSPYAERHSAWWFCEGWREYHNSGKGGGESAEEIVPTALDWIRRNGKRDNWFLHINLWDPHTPYRAPEAFGNPFEDAPIEDWYTEDLRRAQWASFGPGTPQEPAGGYGAASRHPRQPSQIASMDDYRKWIDGYDCGVRYADDWFGRTLNTLADAGVLDDTVIVITGDHGENLGELGVIGDHSVADHVTSRVPMIVRWPGLPGGRVDAALHYQTDVGATLVELAGGEVPAWWDGRSFAPAFRNGRDEGRECVVISQGVWSCMRGVRWEDHLYLRVRHTGLKNLPERMLFNVRRDPHELNDLAESEPDLAARGQALLDAWLDEMLSGSDCGGDPMDIVMAEGGPYHTRDMLDAYCARLRATGRAQHAEFLEKHPTGLAT
ncbi:MAG: sulfatase [Planctomycetes bacterium SM23_25]|nr:MAG: sulfatase [Planctomycetes bacterium SM23_25]